MLDLNEEDLEKLPSDRKVMKFMNEVKKVNEDPEFFSYMTKNAKKHIPMKDIIEITELTEKEIKKITA